MKKTIVILFIFMVIQYFLALVMLSRQRKVVTEMRQRRAAQKKHAVRLKQSSRSNTTKNSSKRVDKSRYRRKTVTIKLQLPAKLPAGIPRQEINIPVPVLKAPQQKANRKTRLDDLLKKLQARHWRLRRTAAQELQRMLTQDPKLIPVLITRLNKASWRRQSEIIRLLGKIGKPALPALLAKLPKKNPKVQRLCIRTIAEMREQAAPAIPELAKIIQQQGSMRYEAAIALGKIGPAALPAVLELLEKGGRRSKIYALYALRRMDKKAQQALPILEKIARDRTIHLRVRNMARYVIKKVKVGKHSPKIRVADNKKKLHRPPYYLYDRSLSKELEKTPTLNARARMLIRLLSGKKGGMRRQAAFYLKNFGQKYLHSLQKLLEDKDWKIQASAAIAIGHIGPRAGSTVPGLILALKSADWHVKSCVARTLSAIGPNVAMALLTCLDYHDWRVRMLAVEVLGNVGKNNRLVVTALLLRLTDPVSDVRALAAEALAKIGAVDNLPRLQQLLCQEADLEVKKNILTTLGKLGPKQVYLAVLQQDDWALQKFSLEQIAAMNSQDAHIFVEALRGPNQATRIAAAQALGAMGRKARAALPALEAIAQSKATKIVKVAATAAISSIMK